jgi:hypothetical protein
MRLAGVLIALGVLAQAAGASAATPPDLVGTWTPGPDSIGAIVGKATAGWQDSSGPNLHLGARPTIVVEKQDGRALSGYVMAPDNSHIPFVALLKRSGRSLIGSMPTGVVNADIGKNDMEWCWTDKTPNSAIVACNVLKREKK